MKTITIKNASKYIIPIALLASCSKKEQLVTTPELKIDLTVSKPVEQSVFQKGDTIQIDALISSPVDLHGYGWRIIRTDDGHVITSKDEHTHGKAISVHESWINNLSEATNAQLSLTAEIDHNGNEVTKTINIILNN